MYLVQNNWDDYHFRTLFHLSITFDGRELKSIGNVKIAHLAVMEGYTPLPLAFEELPHEFFSLGQDVSYYVALKALGVELRQEILRGLRDVAFDLESFQRLKSHPAMEKSLLRNQVEATVRGQYHRVATGGRRYVDQEFVYSDRSGLELEFRVEPESQPPTNVHVLIGSNGVGKTQLLNDLVRASVLPKDPTNKGSVVDLQDDPGPLFANIISVSFSAFDLLRPVMPSGEVKYDHVTIDRAHKPDGGTPASQFATVTRSLIGDRLSRWQRALETLKADPLLSDALDSDQAAGQSHEDAEALFERLSSGHKIVTLAVGYLAALVTESTLVLIDEPETHLHPPLLAAFVRVVSELLVDLNGVAIIATHSPVVLQETPRSCVWKLHRVGNARTAERPELETFGENVGTLTREVFGLEIARSGFHRRLAETVSGGQTYEDVLENFQHQLGSEAKAIARALIAARDRGHR